MTDNTYHRPPRPAVLDDTRRSRFWRSLGHVVAGAVAVGFVLIILGLVGWGVVAIWGQVLGL